VRRFLPPVDSEGVSAQIDHTVEMSHLRFL
jgi:hypothetical protein